MTPPPDQLQSLWRAFHNAHSRSSARQKLHLALAGVVRSYVVECAKRGQLPFDTIDDVIQDIHANHLPRIIDRYRESTVRLSTYTCHEIRFVLLGNARRHRHVEELSPDHVEGIPARGEDDPHPRRELMEALRTVLDAQELAVVEAKYFQAQGMRRIAYLLRLRPAEVSRIHAAAIEKLRGRADVLRRLNL